MELYSILFTFVGMLIGFFGYAIYFDTMIEKLREVGERATKEKEGKENEKD